MARFHCNQVAHPTSQKRAMKNPIVLGHQTEAEREEQMLLWREYTNSPAIQALRAMASLIPESSHYAAPSGNKEGK